MKRIPINEKYPALYVGLNQMLNGHLKRALKFMEENPKQVVFDGEISDREGPGGSFRY